MVAGGAVAAAQQAEPGPQAGLERPVGGLAPCPRPAPGRTGHRVSGLFVFFYYYYFNFFLIFFFKIYIFFNVWLVFIFIFFSF